MPLVWGGGGVRMRRAGSAFVRHSGSILCSARTRVVVRNRLGSRSLGTHSLNETGPHSGLRQAALRGARESDPYKTERLQWTAPSGSILSTSLPHPPPTRLRRQRQRRQSTGPPHHPSTTRLCGPAPDRDGGPSPAVRERVAGPARAAGLLFQIAGEMVRRRAGLSNGQVIGPRGPLFPGGQSTAILAISPRYLPAPFAVCHTEPAPVVFTWLVPITTGEAEVVQKFGWGTLEQAFAAQDPDLADPVGQKWRWIGWARRPLWAGDRVSGSAAKRVNLADMVAAESMTGVPATIPARR
ncbi:suppressor of fused domain protein [Micromonospora phytophila]|uniref:suppressor of fused domain protein n=1 Tax=Micromonospora phytophila TaxID=709888 RepID=UPI0035574D85